MEGRTGGRREGEEAGEGGTGNGWPVRSIPSIEPGRGGARQGGVGWDWVGLVEVRTQCHTRTEVMEAVCSHHDPPLKETQHTIICVAATKETTHSLRE